MTPNRQPAAPADPAPAHRSPGSRPATGDPPAGNRWSAVVAAGLVVFMATLDASVVTVALPVMERDFGVGAALGQWVILGYLLPLIAITLPAGRWADTVGTRAALMTAVIGFGSASLLAGIAPTFALLVTARAIQGVFGGLSFTLLPLVITGAVQPQARGRAMALTTTVGPLGAVSGPAVGGLLTGSLGWPWIFWVNLPVAAAVGLIIARQMPADGSLRRPPTGAVGEILLTGTAAAAVFIALTLAPLNGLVWLLPGVIAVPLTVRWWRGPHSRQVRRAHRPTPVRATQAALFASSVATAGLTFLLPFYLQHVLHRSPTTAGLILLIFPAATAVVGPIAGIIADRRGTRGPIVGGATLLIAGLVLIVPLDPGWSPADLMWRLALAGGGMGLFYGPNMTRSMAAAPQDALGVVGATSSLVRQLGFAAGPAIVTAGWLGAGMPIGAAVAAAAGVGVLTAGLAAGDRRPGHRGPQRHRCSSVGHPTDRSPLIADPTDSLTPPPRSTS